MKYRVLRNCYTGDRYYQEGNVYDLPDSVEKNPKNFQLVGEIPNKVVPTPSSAATEAQGAIPDGEPELYVSDKPYKSKKKKK